MGKGALLRNIFEIGFGLIYVVGAVFNCFYTWRHGAEFYGSFATGAMWPPARQFVPAVVISSATLFTGMLIAFQVIVGLSILSRGTLVVPALGTGAIFCVGAALFSSPGGAIANLIMAGLQTYLAVTR
jgi:hypothetical protein